MEAGLGDAELFFMQRHWLPCFCGNYLEASGAIGTSIFIHGKFDNLPKLAKETLLIIDSRF